jgi:hypothetical protein
VAVNAAKLDRNPVGSEVAFLDYMGSESPLVGQIEGEPMQPAAVAKEHDVGHGVLVNFLGEKLWPSRLVAAEIHRAGQIPKEPVAGVEIDSVNLMTPGQQGFRQPDEKARREALKEEIGAMLCRRPHRAEARRRDNHPWARRRRTRKPGRHSSGWDNRAIMVSGSQRLPVTGSK